MIYNELCYKNRTLIIRKDDIVQINMITSILLDSLFS